MAAAPITANRTQSGRMTSPIVAVYALLLTLTLALTSMAAVEMDVRMSQAQIEKLGRQYGQQAKKRLLAWQRLIDETGSDPEDIKLRKINKFFNQVRFISDIEHWGKKDYWATPVEFLISNGGDCEDFTIAKYYTLRQVGVPVEKLSLAYVKALELNQAHMVLTYYEKPSSTPLILDNLISRIKPANRRPDLLHVYSFNADNLWLTKKGRRSTLVGTSDQLKPWVKLKSRIQNLDKDINVQ